MGRPPRKTKEEKMNHCLIPWRWFCYFSIFRHISTGDDIVTESIATIKARLLVNTLKPRYPLDIAWLASQILGKPVVIDERDFPMNICAIILDKPEYETIHIGVNRNRPRASQRFSIVHELAHHYLEHQGNISFIEEEEDPVLRAEADAFSVEMLMPKHRILSLASKYHEPFSLIHQILRSHNVSLEATCRRIIELEIYRGAFVCFNESKPFFAYNTPGFHLDIDRINSLPRLNRGGLVSMQETVQGVPVVCYFKRFISGNFLATWVEDNPASLYQNLLNKWLMGAVT